VNGGWLPRLALLGLAALVATMALQGQLAYYLRPSYHPLLLAATGLLVLVVLGADRTAGAAVRWRVLVLLVPVLLGFLLPRDPLTSRSRSSEEIERSVLAARFLPADELAARLAQHQRTDREVPLYLLHQAMNHPDARFDGMPLVTTGWLLKRASGKKLLLRYVIVCCAADARLLAVELPATLALDDMPDDSWLRITGKLGALTSAGRQLQVENFTSIPVPKDPYCYQNR